MRGLLDAYSEGVEAMVRWVRPARPRGAPAAWVRGARRGLPARWWIVLGLALVVTVADLVLGIVFASSSGRLVAWDARVYWDALVLDDPYAHSRLGVLGSYLYSPAFLVLLAPLELLGWHAFLFAFTACGAAAGTWLLESAEPSARRAWPLLAVAAVSDLWAGNIHLLLAASIVLGLRSGASWAFPAVTKVTPAVGALWHVARREWRAAGGAMVALGVVVVLSLPAGPDLWLGWLRMLTTQAHPVGFTLLPVPLPLRLAGAAVLVAWAAREDRRWAVPVVCLLALPAIWPTSLALLLGTAALWRPTPVVRLPAVGRGRPTPVSRRQPTPHGATR